MKPRRLDRPPILTVLPPALRLDASPFRCVCSGCVPGLTDVERAAERWAQDRWEAARTAWCKAHGFGVLELLRAERPRTPPGKKSAENTARNDERK